jgi:mercuric ion transport protein
MSESTSPATTGRRNVNWLAAGGLLGAVLASACCVGPLLLLMIGVSGAWISNLTALEPYKPLFALAALGFVGLGFRHVYGRQQQACDDGTYCAKPAFSRVTHVVLWLSVCLVALALTINWWAPLFY